MIQSVDTFLDRRYDPVNYNCLHFTRDVWLSHTGVDITGLLGEVFNPARRTNLRGIMQGFYRVPSPVDPCIVLMARLRSSPHVGVYLRGRVLHLQVTGPEYLPLEIASRSFTSTRYYLCH